MTHANDSLQRTPARPFGLTMIRLRTCPTVGTVCQLLDQTRRCSLLGTTRKKKMSKVVFEYSSDYPLFLLGASMTFGSFSRDFVTGDLHTMSGIILTAGPRQQRSVAPKRERRSQCQCSNVTRSLMIDYWRICIVASDAPLFETHPVDQFSREPIAKKFARDRLAAPSRFAPLENVVGDDDDDDGDSPRATTPRFSNSHSVRKMSPTTRHRIDE